MGGEYSLHLKGLQPFLPLAVQVTGFCRVEASPCSALSDACSPKKLLISCIDCVYASLCCASAGLSVFDASRHTKMQQLYSQRLTSNTHLTSTHGPGVPARRAMSAQQARLTRGARTGAVLVQARLTAVSVQARLTARGARIAAERLTVKKVLGEGSYGQVFEVRQGCVPLQ